MSTKLNTNNLVGTAGEYYVCAELCRQDYLALLTPKNNPVFDVVATNNDGSRTVSIQVKTRSARNKQGWKLGTDMSAENSSDKERHDLFVVLVNLNDTTPPDYYVYKYSDLARKVDAVYDEYMSKPKKDGSPKADVGFRWFNQTDVDEGNKDNWDLIISVLNSAHLG